MLDWLRRMLHLGPDRETIEQTSELVAETRRNITRLGQAEASLRDELRCHRSDPLAEALLRARDREERPA